MDRVTWSLHPIIGSDEDGELLYALIPSDGTYGLRVGEFPDIMAVYDCLTQFFDNDVEGEPIEDWDFQLTPWITIREAEEEYGVPRATLTWACRRGKIEGATKLGNRWRFPLTTFEAWRRAWLRKRRERS